MPRKGTAIRWNDKRNAHFLRFFIKIPTKILLLTEKSTTFAPANETIGVWCNGNTTDSGPVILGSSPSTPTTDWGDFFEKPPLLRKENTRSAPSAHLIYIIE